ncbi:MAG: hypothetical protein KGL43_25880, partial [Burkholderiales bacterium]|nr:hypothetical protein [Burkholderiales bacterium]
QDRADDAARRTAGSPARPKWPCIARPESMQATNPELETLQLEKTFAPTALPMDPVDATRERA